MATQRKQVNFAAGEISPSMYAHAEQVRYQTGLRTCRNMIVKKNGGVENRPGTEYIGTSAQSGGTVRLIPFSFNPEQTYVLELGNYWMRVIKNGEYIAGTDATSAVVSFVDLGSTLEVTYTEPDIFSDPDLIYFTGMVGNEAYNNVIFRVCDVNSDPANTFNLCGPELPLDYFDPDAFLAGYTSGGVIHKISLASPYAEEDLQDLQFVQVADIMIITHPSYRTKRLTRSSDTSWTFTDAPFDEEVERPEFVSIVEDGAGSSTLDYRYRVTALAANGEESQPSYWKTLAITGFTNASPPVITTATHDLLDGDEILIKSVVGMSGVSPLTGQTADSMVNFRRFRVSAASATTLELDGVDSTSWTAWTSGTGTVNVEYYPIRGVVLGTTADPHVLTFRRRHDTSEFNVYRSERDGIYGFIGAVSANVGEGTGGEVIFKDIGITPDMETSNPMSIYQFENKDGEGYPAACGLYQQRLMLGGFPFDPEANYGSRNGALFCYAPDPQLADNSPLSWKIFGKEVNQVRYYLDVGELIVFTNGGEWAVHGGTNGILTPTQLNAKQHSYNKSRSFLPPAYVGVTIPPTVVDDVPMYVQASGSILRSIQFDQAIEGYRGSDMGIFSQHLVRHREIKSVAYQQHPESILWIVLDNGTMLGLTFNREHEIVGWHRHDTDGEIKSVCVVRENNLDVLYMSVKRHIGITDTLYTERLASRDFESIHDAIFLDSSILQDETNADPTDTIKITTPVSELWGAGTYQALVPSGFDFTGWLPGEKLVLIGPDGYEVNCTVINPALPALMVVLVDQAIPVNMREVNLSNWARGVTTVTGLGHLEGKSVSVFADGQVLANPNNPEYPVLTVTGGEVELPEPCARIRVGLPYTSDFQTLGIESESGSTMMPHKKNINGITAYVRDTRGGLWASREPQNDQDLSGFSDLSTFTDYAPREDEPFGTYPRLITESISIDLESDWSKEGRAFMRQTDPLPITILAIVLKGYIPAGVK